MLRCLAFQDGLEVRWYTCIQLQSNHNLLLKKMLRSGCDGVRIGDCGFNQSAIHNSQVGIFIVVSKALQF